MSLIKNKSVLNRHIYNINNIIYTRKSKLKNKKELDNIIIPKPKRKIKRKIFGDLENNSHLSSCSDDSSIDNNNKFYKSDELKITREISYLSLNCINNINHKCRVPNITIDNNDNNYIKKVNNKSIFNAFDGIKNDILEEPIPEKKQMDEENKIFDKFLPCRKEEQMKIYEYIKNGLKTNGNYHSLYIGGMPGTGKTECIRNVIEIIETENKENNDTRFRTLFLNCVDYPKNKNLIKSIYNFIFSKKKKLKIKCWKYFQLLDDFFLKRQNYNGNINLNDPSNSHIVLVIDEIDYIINKSQYLLYNIFNWTTYQNSKIIIISTSNIINISDKLFPKIISRFGKNRILFKPYRREEIREIINYKGIKLNEFEEDALKLLSMKVASVNGDLRRVFLILNKAKELFSSDIKNNKAEKNSLINKFYIIAAFQELFDSKIMNAIKNCKITEKIVISGVLLRNIRDNNCFVKLGELYNSLNILIYKYNECKFNNGHFEIDINWPDFEKIIYSLLRSKILEIDENNFQNFKNNYVHIKIYIDELMIALESDEDYKPIYDYLSNIIS